VPEFGQSDQIRGVVCVDISKDSPALKASVKPGDIITQIGDIEIKNIYDLAFALKYYRAGDQIELTWLSGKNLKKQMIILAKSKR
jgi:S1-C subfamily serine protease